MPHTLHHRRYSGTSDRRSTDPLTPGQIARGILELLLILCMLIVPLLFKSIYMLPAMAALCVLLICIALWDDCTR